MQLIGPSVTMCVLGRRFVIALCFRGMAATSSSGATWASVYKQAVSHLLRVGMRTTLPPRPGPAVPDALGVGQGAGGVPRGLQRQHRRLTPRAFMAPPTLMPATPGSPLPWRSSLPSGEWSRFPQVVVGHGGASSGSVSSTGSSSSISGTHQDVGRATRGSDTGWPFGVRYVAGADRPPKRPSRRLERIWGDADPVPLRQCHSLTIQQCRAQPVLFLFDQVFAAGFRITIRQMRKRAMRRAYGLFRAQVRGAWLDNDCS